MRCPAQRQSKAGDDDDVDDECPDKLDFCMKVNTPRLSAVRPCIARPRTARACKAQPRKANDIPIVWFLIGSKIGHTTWLEVILTL